MEVLGPVISDPFLIRSGLLAEVKGMDPLGLDPVFLELPERNKQSDTHWMCEQLIAHTHESLLLHAETMDLRVALAIVRDLGILVASLRRHGVQVSDKAPLVEHVLLALGNRTGMVPRDTVFHYGPGNPRGERERTFTGDDNERMLIEATRIAFPHLEEAVERCVRLSETPILSNSFAEEAEAASIALDGLITSIILTRKSVDPMFFAVHLRPYFEAVRLGENEYAGSAAAPLSVGMIDHLLWSSDCTHVDYRSFQDHNILYNVPEMKRLYTELMGKPSLVTRFLQTECSDADMRKRNAVALDSILSQIINFRGKHLAVAKSAYSLQNRLKAIWIKGASNVYNIGSAGYGLDTLEMILDLSKESRDKLSAFLPEGNDQHTNHNDN